ncbi:MAG: helicase C-terminal domain-containing protein [Candidatus Rokuibacteriota bacterium]
MPPSGEEAALLTQRETLETALARLRFFLEAEDREWAVRYPDSVAATLELVPLGVGDMAAELLHDAGEITVLSSAFLGRREAVSACLGLPVDAVRGVTAPSPFPVEQRPIVYRPVGRLSRATLPALEPALFDEVAGILAAHPAEKGLIHAASYAAANRLRHHLAEHAPTHFARLIWIEAASAKARALEQHRTTAAPTVLLSPSLREGVDLPDDFLRFQVITKMPYPDLGDPWTAARRARDPRWYALETAKALVQAYGRSCRHAGDTGVTYVLDAEFGRFVLTHRVLLPPWFLDAAHPALRAHATALGGHAGGTADFD